jgi:hypothetical protein
MTGLGSLLLKGLLAFTVTLPPQAPDPDGGRLFGRVLTRDGDVFEGYLRWDQNEGSWADLLHGAKIIPIENYEDAVALGAEEGEPRGRSFDFFGFTVSWDEDGESWPDQAQSAIRFGHLRSIEVLDDDRALLVLKSGDEFEMVASSTDMGDDLRGLVVEDAEYGEVELDWDDLEVVDFSSSAGAASSSMGDRLYGRVTTQWGGEFTGFVAWDNDEIFGKDVLDGDQRGVDHSIPFMNIRAIYHDGDDGARVVLNNGEEIRLEDSNDVDDSNRGIVVADPALGQVTVQWDEFESLELSPPPTQDLYATFDGGRSLYGTVRDDRGESFTGFIRWDNDEEFTWEILDGEFRNVEFDVEFGQIQQIQRISSSRARVTLLDGRSFQLENSNDVDEGNKGILVFMEDGEAVLIPWNELEDVEFHAR